MPEHVFTLAALGHTVDAQTNFLTIFEILESIGAPGLPIILPRLSFVTLWRREEGDQGVAFVERLEIVDPDGEPNASFEVSFAFERLYQRTIGRVQGAIFKKAGCHRVRVSVRRSDQQEWSGTLAQFPIEVLVPEHSDPSLFKPA